MNAHPNDIERRRFAAVTTCPVTGARHHEGEDTDMRNIDTLIANIQQQQAAGVLEEALVLEMARANRWVRPTGTLGEDLNQGILGMIAQGSTLPRKDWRDLLLPVWRPFIDALYLSVAALTGRWCNPRNGLAMIVEVLAWERLAGCDEDVSRVLEVASSFARHRIITTMIAPGVSIRLRPDRWTSMSLLRLATNDGETVTLDVQAVSR